MSSEHQRPRPGADCFNQQGGRDREDSKSPGHRGSEQTCEEPLLRTLYFRMAKVSRPSIKAIEGRRAHKARMGIHWIMPTRCLAQGSFRNRVSWRNLKEECSENTSIFFLNILFMKERTIQCRILRGVYMCVHMHSLLVLTGALSGSPEPGLQEAHVLVLANRVLWLSMRTISHQLHF